MGAMSTEPPQTAAIDALMAVTAPMGPSLSAEAALGALAAAISDAGGGAGVLLWAGEPREGAGHLSAARGVFADVADLDDRVARLPTVDAASLSSADQGGAAAELAQAAQVAAVYLQPMRVGEVIEGLCAVALDDGRELSATARHAIAVGTERAGHIVERVRLRESLERAMAQILLTDERMLGRMGLDIHDGPTQQLSVALLEVQLLEAELADAQEQGLPTPATLRPALGRIYETVGGALHEMRGLIGHLRPAQFEDRRLNEILHDAITGFETRTDCRVVAEWRGEFPVNGVSITQRITLYRILQETLTNAHRHGRAGEVRVSVTSDDAGTTLVVADDGQGFDPDAVQRRRPGTPLARFGVHGMRDRARLLGGSFEISSTPGAGASVRVFLPQWSGPDAEVPSDVA